MTLLGNLALWLALLLGLWGAAAGVLGASHERRDLARSAQRAGRAIAGALSVAVGALAVAVFRDDFNVAYVAAHAGRTLSVSYRWAVLYAGPEGVALCYATALAAWAALAPGELDARENTLRTGLTSAGVAAVTAALVFVMNPFARLPFTPVDGAGLDPALQQAAGAAALPLLLVAAAALTIPFASAIAGLTARPLAPGWAGEAHRWLLSAWVLLAAGTLLGARAAYVQPAVPAAWFIRPDILGWLIVWAAVTIALHYTVVEARGGNSPRWSPALAAVSWALAAVAMAVTAAGAVPPLAVALGVTGAACTGGLVWWYGRRLTDRAVEYPPAPGARRTAGHLAHAGAALLVLACAAAVWRREARVELEPGAATAIAGLFGPPYELTYLGTSRYERGNQIVTAATIDASRAGRRLGVRRAEQLLYVDVMGRQVGGLGSRAALWGGVAADVRVELLGAGTGETVVLRVALNPFFGWVWVGGGLLLLGGLLAGLQSFMRPSHDRG